MFVTLSKVIDVFGVVIDRCEVIIVGVEMMICIYVIESGMEYYVDLVVFVFCDLRNVVGLIDLIATNMNLNTIFAGEEFIRGLFSMLDMINVILNVLLDFEFDLCVKFLKF